MFLFPRKREIYVAALLICDEPCTFSHKSFGNVRFDRIDLLVSIQVPGKIFTIDLKKTFAQKRLFVLIIKK